MKPTLELFNALLSSPASAWIEEVGWTYEEITNVTVKHAFHSVVTPDGWISNRPGTVTITLQRGDEIQSYTYNLLQQV